MNKHLSIVLLFWTFTISSYGQLYEASRYADDNGLPSRIIRDVDQDPDGYLWIAGNNGLYKFDGQQFYAHYSILNDTIGLRDNKINTVLAASDGRVWIATPLGLHVLENEKIHYVELLANANESENYIIELFEDSERNIWVGSYDGLYIIENETAKISKIPLPNFNLHKDNTIWGIREDSSGTIWISRSRKPPMVANKSSLDFVELHFQVEEGVVEEDINAFNYIDFSEDIILISSGSGLLKGTRVNDSILSVENFRNAEGEVVGTDYLYNIIIDNEQNIWTATWKNRFKKYKIVKDRLIEQEVISRNGLMGMTVFARSIFEDAQKNIWISNSNGLYKLSKNVEKLDVFPPRHLESCLENNSIYGLTEDKGGHLWINTPTYLYRINKQDVLEKKCPTDYLTFKNDHFYLARGVLVDNQNRLWVSGPSALSVAQLDENYIPGPFIHFTEANGLPHKWSNEIIQTDDNTFWVGNYIRLVKLELPNGDLRNPIITTYNSSVDRADALVNSYTLNLEIDANGDLWVGTFSGLSRLISEEGEGTFKNYKSVFGHSDQLSNNAIKSIFNDSKGRLWVGTQTGLNLYLPETDTFHQFGREEGLPSEYILGIAEDTKGYLWVATTNGLFKAVYNESMEGFVHIEYFTNREGLADNITNKNALYIDVDDNIFIGSSKGISMIDNSETSIKTQSFNLGLTTLESIQKKEHGFVSIKNRIKDGELTLSYKENSIQLSYAVLDFTNPDYNRYRHKFLPVSDDWIETNSDAQLTYYNLAPGTYEFLLDGSNNQGVWSEEPIHLKLTIMPPFWKSNWAITLYALLLLGVIRLMYVLRIKKRIRELEQETRLEKALVREREQLRNENAADFHDELGSKVTKISMFLTLAERTLEEQKDPSNWFGKIRENVKDLSGSFRDLLWVIDPQKDSLSDAVLRLKDFGEDLFCDTNVSYSTSGYSEELIETTLDPQTKKQVVLIFKEAMHNCAKYSESTVVELTIETSQGYSSIRLQDNGKGFNVHRQSKGRGLTNMKNRSEKIGGNLSIVSGKTGTLVTLHQIPHLRD